MDNVLIIEDDASLCNRLSKAIAKEGFNVHVAYDGEHGLTLFKHEDIDIIISDYRMPGKSGLEVMRSALALRPETGFILITGHGDYDLAIEAINEGALDYLKKPVDVSQLLVALGRFTERKELRTGIAAMPTILVLEDDDPIRNRFVKALKREDYAVIEGSDGKDGLEQIDQNKIDIVITDLRMPNLDGLPFIKQALENNNDYEIIVVTGYGDEDIAIEALRLGVCSYLRKPFNIEELLLEVEKAIEKLTLKRSLSYRNRDVTLSQEVIEVLMRDKRHLFDLRGASLKAPALDVLKKAVNAIPEDIVIFNEQLDIVYMNNACTKKAGDAHLKIDAPFLTTLGFSHHSITAIKESVEKVYKTDKSIHPL